MVSRLRLKKDLRLKRESNPEHIDQETSKKNYFSTPGVQTFTKSTYLFEFSTYDIEGRMISLILLPKKHCDFLVKT